MAGSSNYNVTETSRFLTMREEQVVMSVRNMAAVINGFSCNHCIPSSLLIFKGEENASMVVDGEEEILVFLRLFFLSITYPQAP
ncbi:hypothetical protein C5167_028828 [Papaver somniferum]|nr:hypothetical protein C5167_028828 [Papaver somniferum]